MIRYEKHADGYSELTVDGQITREEIDRVWTEIERDMPEQGQLKLLETIGSLEGMDASALFEDLKLAAPMLKRVSHVALVADQKWIGMLGKAGDLFLSADVRTFRLDQMEEARVWLAAAR